MPDTHTLADAYSGPDAFNLAINHAFAHIRAVAFGDPNPEPNPYCTECPDRDGDLREPSVVAQGRAERPG